MLQCNFSKSSTVEPVICRILVQHVTNVPEYIHVCGKHTFVKYFQMSALDIMLYLYNVICSIQL